MSRSGIHASDGTARIAPTVGASSSDATRDNPTTAPTTRPRLAPLANPSSTRCVEIATWIHRSPRAASSVAAAHTDDGGGSS